MKFESNWNTNAVLHHLASQTYMRAWKHGSSSVYFIEKDDSNINNGWNRNTKSLAYIENFFSRRAGALIQSLSDCEKYFEPLKGFKVKFEGEILKDPLELNKYYRLYDEWIIYDSNSKTVSEAEKEKLKFEIDNIHVRDIEVGWDRLYENNWPNVRNDILNAVSTSKGANMIPSVRREELVKFMVSLEWRTKPTHPVLEILFKKLISLDNTIEEYMKESIPEAKRMYPFIDTEKELMLHNLLLKYYHQFLNNNGVIYDEAQQIIKYMNIELLIAEKGSEFITSDNPVCRFSNSDNATEYIFPITPEIACAVRKGNPYDKSNYYVTYLNKDSVFNYNKKLKDNCYKGYILRKSSLTYYFK
ncbi:DUF4238 domain-containing protein [Metabacillus indicus]|uniref:DUF4238 domain-containing protein n=1 Tax=Metabacillus indicus TaxID=246786 RepID=UPI003CF9D15A